MSKKDLLPWESELVKAMTGARATKGFNLQLPIDYLEKLRWLSENTGKSQQRIIREALFPRLDSEIKELLRDDIVE